MAYELIIVTTHHNVLEKKVLRQMPFLPKPFPFIWAWDRHKKTLKCALDDWLFGMKMREGRLRWYGHVVRRDQEYVRRMMEKELSGKRKRGRMKRRFPDVVKKDMGKLVRQRRTLKTATPN